MERQEQTSSTTTPAELTNKPCQQPAYIKSSKPKENHSQQLLQEQVGQQLA